jgi:hypothetical protein
MHMNSSEPTNSVMVLHFGTAGIHGSGSKSGNRSGIFLLFFSFIVVMGGGTL